MVVFERGDIFVERVFFFFFPGTNNSNINSNSLKSGGGCDNSPSFCFFFFSFFFRAPSSTFYHSHTTPKTFSFQLQHFKKHLPLFHIIFTPPSSFSSSDNKNFVGHITYSFIIINQEMGEVAVSSSEDGNGMDFRVKETEDEEEEGAQGGNKRILITNHDISASSSAAVVRWESFLPKMVLSVLLVEADDSTRQIIAALLRKCSYTGICLPSLHSQMNSGIINSSNLAFQLCGLIL